ncbi:MAG: ATP-binding protein [Nannocystales bacterium]
MNDLNNIDWERRATASEKTVDLLKKKVVDMYLGGTQTAMSKQLERAKQREEANQQRRALMEVRQQELARNAEVLEGQVAERTRAIRTILDNVAFGFVLVGRELKVLPGFTRSCNELFGREEIVAGTPLIELLGADDNRKWALEILLEQVFEDLMPEETTLEQIPSRFPIGDRVLSMKASVVRGDDDEVVSMLLSISDVTALEEAQREAQRNGALVSILGKRVAFGRFVADARNLLEQARDEEDQAVIRRLVHTVKGNAASWGLVDVASVAHAVEDEEVITAEGLQLVDSAMAGFLQDSEEILGISYGPDTDPTCSVTRSKVRELRKLADAVGDEAQGARLRRWATAITQCPAADLVGPMDMFVDGLAERLGKSVHLELKGMDTSVDPDTMAPVFRNLTHLVRNSLDHGIEAPDERGEKPRSGTLRIEVSSEEDAYTVTVSDDGRGIDVERVVQKALAMNVIEASELKAMSRADQLELIFHDGLSSAKRTTETSGRGVGMAAIRTAAQDNKGSIEVSSVDNEGTRIVVSVPKPIELRLAS